MTWADFSIYTSINILHGAGELAKFETQLSAFKKPLIITSQGFVNRDLIRVLLGDRDIEICSGVLPNPSLDFLVQCHLTYKNMGFTEIVAIGGGSVMDVAKILSVSLPNCQNQSIEKILEEDRGSFTKKIPLVLVPTTCGTGAEVTPFATIWDFRGQKKMSLESQQILPSKVILDPALLKTLPPKYILFSALDSISHALESLWNKNKTSESEKLAKESLQLSLEFLPRVMKEPANIEFLDKLLVASTFAGMAIAITRTAVAHAISYPITMYFGVPHGLACSFTLEKIIQQYLAEVENEPNQELLHRAGKVLHSLRLSEVLKEYFVDEDLMKIPAKEFENKSRINNFSGKKFNIYECISASLHGECDDYSV
ncbi:phosphonoacetaldehyde reductase [Polynucleobacter wuianus]|uniref:phosphonoacetaldehyde reductase n=1 Tax=Polynucleobacter wuianus TaxID=1743168 RepID=UPI001C0D5789|nr:phosphonoacetaldehyde reductase [Polynucleobacter wuianus]MBU3610988.1 phosphonoacetaldehyde reductase [Polynucleobacter wuianus]